MNGLILHCGAESVPRAALDAIVVPPSTKTWHPFGHGQFLDMVLDTYAQSLPVALDRVDVGLTREGARMFFTASFKSHDPGSEWGIVVGGRNSIDQSFGGALVVGASVFVCDNMCLSGDSAKYVRKHTLNAWDDLVKEAQNHAGLAWNQFGQMTEELNSFRDLKMDDEQVWAALGVLMGRKVIKSGQMLNAMKYWANCPHESHKTEDLFAFYQAVNHSLKGTAPERIVGNHVGLHSFALDMREVDANCWELPARPKAEVVTVN